MYVKVDIPKHGLLIFHQVLNEHFWAILLNKGWSDMTNAKTTLGPKYILPLACTVAQYQDPNVSCHWHAP